MPASGGGAAASGADGAPQSKQAGLMISGTQPFRPKVPSMDEIISGLAGTVRVYAQNLFRYVSWAFASFLYDDEVIELCHPLYASRCPAINNTPKHAASGAEWRPTSIMEPMDMKHCIWALTNSGFWEGAVSIWNLDSFQTKAFDIDFDLKDPSWLQFLVLKR